MIATPYLIGALDVGSTKTCAVIGELILEGDGPAQVKVLGVGQVKPGGIRRDAVSNIEETTDEIRQAEDLQMMGNRGRPKPEFSRDLHLGARRRGEEPEDPELVLDTDRETVEESAKKVVSTLEALGYVSHR